MTRNECGQSVNLSSTGRHRRYQMPSSFPAIARTVEIRPSGRATRRDGVGHRGGDVVGGGARPSREYRTGAADGPSARRLGTVVAAVTVALLEANAVLRAASRWQTCRHSARIGSASRQRFERSRGREVDDAFSAIGRSVRPYVVSEFTAMSGKGIHRSLAGLVADLAIEWDARGSTSHRRQDKSADRGRAHVVGLIDVSGARSRSRCWRSRPKYHRNQCSYRRRSLRRGSVGR